MNVLIIEDEPLAQEELKRLLVKVDHDILILACLDAIESSVEWLSSNPAPDLIFMDIQLADGLSFEIFGMISVKAPVIFTTAYDLYAIDAFKVNSIDYLLKPIEEDALKAAINKFLELKEQYQKAESNITTQQLEHLLSLSSSNQAKQRFVITMNDKIHYVKVEDIAYFSADNNHVFLIQKDKQRWIINYKLDQLETVLDPASFYRINRKYIISLEAINEVHKFFNNRLIIKLKTPPKEQVIVSRARVSDFLKWMEG